MWCKNIKETDIYGKIPCSIHAEENLIKKIKKYKYMVKSQKYIDIYSIRITKDGIIKCAKPCIDCVNHILKSSIKIKNIYWSDFDKLIKISRNNILNITSFGKSIGRQYYQKKIDM